MKKVLPQKAQNSQIKELHRLTPLIDTIL